MNNEEIKLEGGNMNAPVLKDGRICKERTPASENIHALLCHVRAKSIDWVPESFGIDEAANKHVFSYVEGEVPHDIPSWIWDESILIDVAQRLCAWHNAAADFVPHNDRWLLACEGGADTICHNDFAPYNWVFRDRSFAGLIDFDTCAPGSRLWDIAYTAYRIVPLLPDSRERDYVEYAPFSQKAMRQRLVVFLDTYEHAGGYRYLTDELISVLIRRLQLLADWSRTQGRQSGNEALEAHARMYELHGMWLAEEGHRFRSCV